MFFHRIIQHNNSLLSLIIIFVVIHRGDEGSRNLVSKRYLTTGSGSNSGVEELEVNSTYYWKPIQDTSLSLCIVLAQNETKSRLETVSGKNLIYVLHICSPSGHFSRVFAGSVYA